MTTPPSRYDAGGILTPGMTVTVNTSGQPERVLTPDQFDDHDDGDES